MTQGTGSHLEEELLLFIVYLKFHFVAGGPLCDTLCENLGSKPPWTIVLLRLFSHVGKPQEPSRQPEELSGF
jgi:hypothetical protein